MTRPNILKYISAAAISLAAALPLHAQETRQEETASKHTEAPAEKEPPVFGGVTLTADLAGVVMKSLGADWSQMEAAVRLNFKERYFPVFELGYGESDKEGNETANRFETGAPYFRIGLDYNFNARKWQTGNRYYLGVRYAFTSFKYDISAADFTDPVWGEAVPFDYSGLQGRSHWGEVVFGIEAKMWGFFRLGWNVRYKMRFGHNEAPQGSPWYVPGFGKNGNSCLGGTFNIIFDI